ncbi:hypothetical protein D9615_002913 [Tricholomella constricta]|uniref:Dipeptidyl-peptidase V n=1 Tax=Tricholomella constricta TaxID=117010 RepID=A0A8H5M679_9AGAR|nr:hypothetical protein D9615_002913 [Tricholomella constricta]
MRFPLTFLGLTAQIPFQSSPPPLTNNPMTSVQEFSFKEEPNIFSPKDLVQLRRPGAAVANDAGDLVLVPFSEYSLKEKKNKKSILLAPIESAVEPLEIQLEKGGEAFWIQSRTVAHVVEAENGLEIYALDIKFETESEGNVGVLATSEPPVLIVRLPNKSATNFRYSVTAGHLVFSDYVYADGNLTSVKEQDEAWDARGNTAYVYDTTYVRHWDTWVGNKKQVLFSVPLVQDPDRKWVFKERFTNLLQGTKHSSPVEPFGGTDDFDVSRDQVIYTTKDPELDEAWHTKQNVYIVDIKGVHSPRELTSGKQGAIHSPVLNTQATKAAWLELDKDGYESDRAKIVVYDLEKNVRYTLTQRWDRSPDALAFSKEGNFIYFTAGDEAIVKVFVLPVPPTPSTSTTDPELPKKYTLPVALTHSKAASGIQPLYTGRLLFSQSSLTSPNDVFIIRDLKRLEDSILQSDEPLRFDGQAEQITRLTESALKSKKLSPGESFWFKGANDKNVQGWALKPRGWTSNEKKKWPVVLLIHGGPQGAWEDQWSNRWNPNVFAQQGYFVIMINPTGSTTFGQEFTDAIAEDWGGKPFVDMQKGWKYALDAYPESQPVRVGADMQSSHPEYGFNFKALVAHDGVFDSNYNGYSTDELFFFNHEWGGRPWEKKSKALSEKFSPSNFVSNWNTPQLLIHGSKDYRLPDTESIGAFHALQQLGVRSRLVIFPDENHWVLNHGNSLKWHYEVFRWFDEFVGNSE